MPLSLNITDSMNKNIRKNRLIRAIIINKRPKIETVVLSSPGNRLSEKSREKLYQYKGNKKLDTNDLRYIQNRILNM